MVSLGCDMAIRVPSTGVQLSGTCARNPRGSRHGVGEIHHRCANFRIFRSPLCESGGYGLLSGGIGLDVPPRLLAHGLVIPLLGFLFLPLTTLAYAWMINTHMRIEGLNLLILVVAAVIDAGGLGGGEYHRRRR